MTDKKRERRSAEQLAQDHFDAKLKSMSLAEKVTLVANLKEQIKGELDAKKAAYESANALTADL